MIRTNIFTSFIAMIVLAAVASAQIQPGGSGTFTTITFNKTDFDQSLQGAVGPNVMGYQYVLIKNGAIVSEKAGGKAHSWADGDLDMTTSTPSNIGSVAKFLSGTAMIHLMEKTDTWDAGQSLQQKLDRPFLSMVPNVWIMGSTPGVENITIRQLLQHRSGFDDAKPSNRNVLGFLKDADGFNPAQYNQREYSNINFVLNGYLIPMYAYPTFKDTLNAMAAMYGLDEEGTDAFVRQSAGISMHSIMKTRIWDNMTPKILPNCDGTSIANVAALGYSSKWDFNGEITSAIDNQGHCGGHGGYFLSSRGLANYLAHFSSTNLIVTSEGRNAMFNESMATNDRLVWSSSTSNNWLGTNFNMPNIVWSNGIAGGYRTVIIRLPQNYYLVLLTNSPDLSAGALYTAGVNAFIAGMDHNF